MFRLATLYSWHHLRPPEKSADPRFASDPAKWQKKIATDCYLINCDFALLPWKDSNPHRRNQNPTCYHYTTRQLLSVCECKVIWFWWIFQMFLQVFLNNFYARFLTITHSVVLRFCWTGLFFIACRWWFVLTDISLSMYIDIVTTKRLRKGMFWSIAGI